MIKEIFSQFPLKRQWFRPGSPASQEPGFDPPEVVWPYRVQLDVQRMDSDGFLKCIHDSLPEMRNLPFDTSLDHTEASFKFLLSCENFIDKPEVRDFIRDLNMTGVLVKVAEEMVEAPIPPSYCCEELRFAQARRQAELNNNQQIRMF